MTWQAGLHAVVADSPVLSGSAVPSKAVRFARDNRGDQWVSEHSHCEEALTLEWDNVAMINGRIQKEKKT